MVTAERKNSSNNALSIEQLLRASLQGDSRAYQQFLTAISHYLRRFVAKRLPAADVEDVLQDILISIHKARHTYDGKRSALPWISAIARYRLTDYLRRYYSDMRHAQVDISSMQDFLTQDVTKAPELSEYIDEEVQKLPDRQQKIIYLLHTEGYTAKEVGAKLGMKESAVKVAAHRAYKLIKSRLTS